jgi:hypothetical protein
VEIISQVGTTSTTTTTKIVVTTAAVTSTGTVGTTTLVIPTATYEYTREREKEGQEGIRRTKYNDKGSRGAGETKEKDVP